MISMIKIKPSNTKPIINKFNDGLDIIGTGPDILENRYPIVQTVLVLFLGLRV